MLDYAAKLVSINLIQKTLKGTLEAPPSRVALLVDPLLLFCYLLRWCLLLCCYLLGCHL